MRTETTPRPNRKPRPPAVSRPTRKRAAGRKKNSESDVTIRKRGKIYFMYHKRRWRMPWRLIIPLVLVFMCGIGIAVSFAQIHSVERQITQTRQRYMAQQATNAVLEAAMVEYAYEVITQRARELGLSEPDPSQIIYFYAPHLTSHVVITYDRVLPQENYFWQGIRGFFSGIADRIFG